MKDSKRLRLRGVAWTILGLAFLLMILLAVTDGNWRTSILCLVCFLGFTGAFGKAQRFFGVADFIAGHEAMEESFKQKPFSQSITSKGIKAGEDIKKGDAVYLDENGKANKS